jgi:predicted acylesterase/phospholipase RssA
MVKSLCEGDGFFPLERKDVFQLSWSKPIGWAAQFGRSLARALRANPRLNHRHAASELGFHLREAMPAGFFSLREYESFLERFFVRASVPTDFRRMPRRLFIVATDLDLAERAVFGLGRLEDVSIPRAIAASSAIPIFYEPVKIGDRHYVDGAVGQVGHVDVAIKEGAGDILVINPLVPIRNDGTQVCIPHLNKTCASITDRGFFSVWDQAMRMEVRTKLHLGLARFASEHPKVRIECAEPPSD